MSDATDDMFAALSLVVRELETLGVTYYVGGSAASSNYGTARSTLDVDLVADLAQEHVAPLTEALQADCYVSAATAADAVRRKSCFNVIHLRTSFNPHSPFEPQHFGTRFAPSP